jgi:hypothetical protein
MQSTASGARASRAVPLVGYPETLERRNVMNGKESIVIEQDSMMNSDRTLSRYQNWLIERVNGYSNGYFLEKLESKCHFYIQVHLSTSLSIYLPTFCMLLCL